MVKKLQPLNLTEVNPAVPGEFILNPSGDPD